MCDTTGLPTLIGENSKGKKPPRTLSRMPSITEESSTTRKNPQQPPTGPPTQSTSEGKPHQDLPFRPTEQPTQSAAAFKIPGRPASQRPRTEGITQDTSESRNLREQPARGTSEGKKPQGPTSHPPPTEGTTQGSSKGKQPQRPPSQQPLPRRELTQPTFDFTYPLRPASQRSPTEGSAQSTSEGKKPQKQPSRQPQTEQPTQSVSEGKKPQKTYSRQPQTEQPTRSLSEGKKPQEPTSQLPPKEETTQSTSKGKQPMRPSKDQPIGAKAKREKCRHVEPLQKEMEAALEELQDYSEHQVRHRTRDKQSSVGPAAKGKQPMPEEEFGNPKLFIARIPVRRNAAITRVLVSVGPDTAFRHPQTFFFKNVPCLEPYWGYLNDKASTAQRIIRLYNGDQPTPYFLMVCRGEHPKVVSPRNDNWVFAGFYEPIFNDAFVFKLGEPEVYEDGYAKYVHIEDDFGGLKWLPLAIRVAAKKVECAEAVNANPGFPDMESYADKATISNDNKRMYAWRTAIRKAEIKYGNSILAGDTTSELPEVSRMASVFEQWAAQLTAWRKEDALPYDQGLGSFEYRKVQEFILKVREGMEAIRDAVTLKAAAASTNLDSTNLDSSDPELTDAVEEAKHCFVIVRDVFIEIEATANENLTRQVYETMTGTETAHVINVKALKRMVEAMEIDYTTWKEGHHFPPDFDTNMLDEFALKMRRVIEAIEQHKSKEEVMRLANELKEGQDILEAAVLTAEASMNSEGLGRMMASIQKEEDSMEVKYEEADAALKFTEVDAGRAAGAAGTSAASSGGHSKYFPI